jgi:phage shock protein E
MIRQQLLITFLCFPGLVFAVPDGSGKASIENPAIDMPAYLEVAREASQHRQSHRLTEAEFIAMSREPNTIILDARSAEKYAELHISKAVNLSFPDITVDSLAELLPDKNVRILIYCNNNFANAPKAFPSKRADASLNISTYISLYSYGYKNVYELGPLVEIEKSKLEFVSDKK